MLFHLACRFVFLAAVVTPKKSWNSKSCFVGGSFFFGEVPRSQRARLEVSLGLGAHVSPPPPTNIGISSQQPLIEQDITYPLFVLILNPRAYPVYSFQESVELIQTVLLLQCDERHPVCRNCEKSKRECLGYDPVFRSQPGASSIHPAPSQPSLLVAPQAPNVGPSPPPPNHNHNHHTATGAPSYSPPVAGTTPSSASPVVESLELANPLGPPADEATVHPPVTVLDLIEDQPSMASALEGADKLQCAPLPSSSRSYCMLNLVPY
jgi:hypothetical protein